MKNVSKLIYIVLALSFTVVHAQTLSRDEQDIKTLLAKEKLSVDGKTEVYNMLDRIIDNKISISTKDLLEMCYAYSKLENSDAPYRLIYKLKKGNPSEFKKALDQLAPKKRARINQIINMLEAEDTYGNG
jgi:hypothetical protein